MERRGFLKGLVGVCAPAIIRTPGLLMPIKALKDINIITPEWETVWIDPIKFTYILRGIEGPLEELLRDPMIKGPCRFAAVEYHLPTELLNEMTKHGI